MSIDLYKLAKDAPNISITITAQDLILANEYLIDRVWKEAKRDNQKAEKLLTREDVLERLSVVPSTLWRWQKSGYLVPVQVGGQNRYRLSDIEAIIQGINTKSYENN